MLDFGQLCRKYRLAKGLSVRGLADKVGVKHSAISQLETGAHSKMKLKNLVSMQRVLEIPFFEMSQAAKLLPKVRNYIQIKHYYDVIEIKTAGDLIASERAKRMLSRDELARLAGVHSTCLSDLERKNKGRLNQRVLTNVCFYLGFNLLEVKTQFSV